MNTATGSILVVPAERICSGDRLSPRTELRCEDALALFRRGGFSHMLLTGGIFEPWQTHTAADLMRQWFLERSVSDAQILVERNSVDTFQNIEFGLQILKKAGLEDANICVVSEQHHTLRIALTFRLGYGRIVTRQNVSSYRLKMTELLAEWFFIATHAIDPRGQFLPWIKLNRRRRARHEQPNA